MMPVFEIYEKSNFYKETLPGTNSGASGLTKRLSMRTIAVIFTAIMAMIVPKFGLFISLTGSFACTCLAFILPIMMYDMLFKEESSKTRKTFHKVVLVVGITAGIISFIIAFSALVKAFNEQEDEIDADIALLANTTTSETTSISGINRSLSGLLL
jgi:amino acid transporter